MQEEEPEVTLMLLRNGGLTGHEYAFEHELCLEAKSSLDLCELCQGIQWPTRMTIFDFLISSCVIRDDMSQDLLWLAHKKGIFIESILRFALNKRRERDDALLRTGLPPGLPAITGRDRSHLKNAVLETSFWLTAEVTVTKVEQIAQAIFGNAAYSPDEYQDLVDEIRPRFSQPLDLPLAQNKFH